MIKEGVDSCKEETKAPEKVDDFLLSLFKSLDKQKSKDDRKSVEKKVVVRRLPPTMTEERFLNEASPLPECNYMYFVPGDVHAAPFHHSRVYINFLKEDDMYMFTEKFDGYVFVDDTGDEYPATVELAPYQRIPKKKLDKDPNWGKIHENPVFLEFKHNFEQKTIDTNLKTTQHFFESVEDKSQEQDSSTPLLEYLAKQNDRLRARVNQQREERERRKKMFNKKQEKDEVRRNHKGEKEIFVKPKLISKNSPFHKRLIEDKPLKDAVQKKIIKSHKDDADFVDEKKKYYEDGHKVKSEDAPKVDKAKKIELKLKTTKLNSSNKHFDNDSKDEVQTKTEKVHEDHPRENHYEIKKRPVASKFEHADTKTSASWKRNKTYEDRDNVNLVDAENGKKYRPEVNKKIVVAKRAEHRHDAKPDRADRRIRNKDRPAIEIYRPGMGKLSKLKSDNDCAIEPESKK